MKNLIYLLAVLFILYGCNKDDNSDGNNPPNSALLVKNIHTDYRDGGGSDEIFHYQDNKLKAIEYDCYDNVVYYEYNALNKVSKSYHFDDANFDINTFNLQNVEIKGTTEYIYENNRLVRLKSGDYIPIEISYKDGLIKNVVIYGYESGNIIITYENNEIASIFVSRTNGDSKIHTFLFDEKINPMYQIFHKYGIIADGGCKSYNDYMLFKGIPLFKNNVITQFVDNIPKEPAAYTYFDSGVPEAITYGGYNGPYTHFFSY